MTMYDPKPAPRIIQQCQIGGAKLEIVAGDLLALQAQGVICYSSTSLTLHSAVAARIVHEGGASIRADAAKHLPARVGDALVISAGRLPMRYVLIAVTNELRTTPTLETVRAALRVALARAAALGIDSLALPLLRARRRLDDDDVLVITLAALIEHLCGPTSVRQLLLTLDETAQQARLAMQRVAPFIESLKCVGALRAQAQALPAAGPVRWPAGMLQERALAHELLLQRGRLLMQIEGLLLRLLTDHGQLPGGEGLRTELQHCQAEIRELSAVLEGTLERAR
jgi:O-acetyl-ADP-ribose deacetylase (regulator of RNase III)